MEAQLYHEEPDFHGGFLSAAASVFPICEVRGKALSAAPSTVIESPIQENG